MKASASINWKNEELIGSIAVKAEGSTMMDTLDNLKAAILEKLDGAPDHQVFGWETVSILIVRS